MTIRLADILGADMTGRSLLFEDCSMSKSGMTDIVTFAVIGYGIIVTFQSQDLYRVEFVAESALLCRLEPWPMVPSGQEELAGLRDM